VWSWYCLWSIDSWLEKKLFYLKNKILIGIRILDGRITTLLEARSVALFANDTDIKSASWG
jgi:hypothetical protein